MDCWVVVPVTSLRDWLDNAAVESAPVLPFVQKPPFRVIPGWLGPAEVGQKIWASTLDVNPATNSGTTATLAAATLRYRQKSAVFNVPLMPRPWFPPDQLVFAMQNRPRIPKTAHGVCDLSTTLGINRKNRG